MLISVRNSQGGEWLNYGATEIVEVQLSLEFDFYLEGDHNAFDDLDHVGWWSLVMVTKNMKMLIAEDKQPKLYGDRHLSGRAQHWTFHRSEPSSSPL